MKILLTGATGYIGKRLLPQLIELKHEVVCAVRDKNRFVVDYPNVSVIELDLLQKDSLKNIPADIDGAYYLVHSMSTTGDFGTKEAECATNFNEAIKKTNVKHVVYLSGIVNDHTLSKHLQSRKAVEDILKSGSYHLTTLRAGIIIGSGSASFEIVRDLVEKLPVMITPRWILTKSQPIAIRNVIQFLTRTIFNSPTYGHSYDIGGPDVLTYKDMMLLLAQVRKLKRYIYSLPIMTPRLSSYWLYFVTSTSYYLAVNLVNSMKVEVVAKPNDLAQHLGIDLMPYKKAVEMAFMRIQQNEVVSSWKDSVISSHFPSSLQAYVEVPVRGCYVDSRASKVDNRDKCIARIWKLGGKVGWYYGNWLWQLRGTMDKMAGGVGLRRGRTHDDEIASGDVLDFWRVVLADRSKGRLLLYAEMKLPGEAWLEFNVDGDTLHQTATFRPRGLWGRAYWLFVLPFHHFIFGNMIKKIACQRNS
ncbi:Uncharacterized conserved protein YbjT, contains NAD(P)-binding and DUF2867 domains [Saccharicrinis carchari]|uniref:Uncharacterized conserved protein YbjT, contains NAD(P)-binding and DUF2867 domains n=1 Tax=Saccharicrinis carchari TaxID=1168039 RepID=A0A521C0S9_SACCC|nr:SDR family oxidoreductase [Saccharicrinis carchari]SMO52330.1 Uncharacterized conserved protein YbjT, contains NAD(P)-binding and DUF2867 domains [Saccharicrinis carchari]